MLENSINSEMILDVCLKLCKHRMSITKSAILFFLFKYGPHHPGVLATYVHVSTAAISEAINRLKDLSLISKTRDGKDQRTVRIDLTESGKNLIQDILNSK